MVLFISVTHFPGHLRGLLASARPSLTEVVWGLFYWSSWTSWAGKVCRFVQTQFICVYEMQPSVCVAGPPAAAGATGQFLSAQSVNDITSVSDWLEAWRKQNSFPSCIRVMLVIIFVDCEKWRLIFWDFIDVDRKLLNSYNILPINKLIQVYIGSTIKVQPAQRAVFMNVWEYTLF